MLTPSLDLLRALVCVYCLCISPFLNSTCHKFKRVFQKLKNHRYIFRLKTFLDFQLNSFNSLPSLPLLFARFHKWVDYAVLVRIAVSVTIHVKLEHVRVPKI